MRTNSKSGCTCCSAAAVAAARDSGLLKATTSPLKTERSDGRGMRRTSSPSTSPTEFEDSAAGFSVGACTRHAQWCL